MVDKVAVVNGGGGGIGRAVVARLAAAGHAIYILDNNPQYGQAAADQLRAQGHQAHYRAIELRNSAEVKSVFADIEREAGHIDVLVNLAGGTLHIHPIQDFPLAKWQEVIDVNLKSTFLCCQAVCKPMRLRRSGVIINTASNIGVTGAVGRSAYAASKAAVTGFTMSLALELAPHGVRVNAIAPGLTATARVQRDVSEAQWRQMSETVLMGRPAQPDEIADGVAFLASDESAFMTGQTFHVNGGMIFS